METLYEIINKMADGYMDDVEIDNEDVEESEKLSKEDLDYRADKLTKNLKKKIGTKEYNKLEEYIQKNKDNEFLKELVGSTAFEVGFSNLVDLLTASDEAVVDVKLTYKLTLSVYKKLKANDYDPELAILE